MPPPPPPTPTKSKLLVWGQANPEAMRDDYQGVYLNSQDMRDMIQQIDEAKAKGERIPVKIEHIGEHVGHVVSAWVHNNTLQCCLEIEHQTLESAIGQELIKKGLVSELSLGYLLDVQQSKDGRFNAKKKYLQEISLVKKGAREKCKILGMSGNKT
jgi:hypothetical protein